MDRGDAEEYTQALGQVVGGSYRQVVLAYKLGVPAALGLELGDWVRNRLGGYVHLEISERQEAVKELTAEGFSTAVVAEFVGVDERTVQRDKDKTNVLEKRPKRTKPKTNVLADLSEKRKEQIASAEDAEVKRNQRQGLYVGLREIERWMYIFNAGAQRQYIIDSIMQNPGEVDAQKLLNNLSSWANNIIQTMESLNEQIRRDCEVVAAGNEGRH